MMTLRITITEEQQDWMGSRSAFNAIVREALTKAADYWIDQFLPKRFGANAASYMHYPPNSARWWKIKQDAKKFPNFAGVYKLVQKPPQVLVMTGELRDAILDRVATGNYRVIATATGASEKNPEGKFNVRVPVPFPHPVNTKYAGQITKLLPLEYETMRRIAVRELIGGLKAANYTSKTRIAAATGGMTAAA